MDRRERILTRMEELLQGVCTQLGGWIYARNRGELPDEMRPALILLDADEAVGLPVQLNQARGQLRTPPMIMEMRPQLFAVLKDREPKNLLVGTDLLTARRLILPLLLPSLLTDDTLKSLVGSNGFIRYEGLLTDLATGRSMRGECQFNFVFGYVLRLDELTQGV